VFELSEGSIGNCTGTLVGTLKYKHTTKGEQTLSAVNVAYAVSSLLNMSTSVGQVATADAYITIQGTNFLDLTLSTYKNCFGVYCRCTSSDNLVAGSNVTLNNDMISFSCNAADCDEYIYGKFEFSNTCSSSVLGSISDENVAASIVKIVDTQTSQSLFMDSNQTVTISGVAFYETNTSRYSFNAYVQMFRQTLSIFTNQHFVKQILQ
jgi:hypothetical protein